MKEKMNSLKKTARGAGILYIIMDIFMIFSGMVVDPKIYVPGDAVATVSNILASEWLFRLGFVSWIVGYIVFLFLVLALYNLFKSVDKGQARLMVILVVASVLYSVPEYAQSVRSHPALKRCRTSLSFQSGSVTNAIDGIFRYVSTWDSDSRDFLGSLAHSPRDTCLQIEIRP